MLLLVLILVLLAFGLLLVALLTGSVLWAWVSVAVSIVAGAVLLVDELQRRSAVRAGGKAFEPVTGHTSGDDSLRSLPGRSDIESVTEIIPVVPPSAGAPRDRGTPERVQPDTGGRFDPAADTQQTVVMPIVQPSGSADLPSGATSRITPSSGKSSRNVVESGDRAAAQHPLFNESTVVGVDSGSSGRPSSVSDPTVAVQPPANLGSAQPGPDPAVAATPVRPSSSSPGFRPPAGSPGAGSPGSGSGSPDFEPSDAGSSSAGSSSAGSSSAGSSSAGSPDWTSPAAGSPDSGSSGSASQGPESPRAEFAPSGSGPAGGPSGSTRRSASEPGPSEQGGAADATAVVAAHPATVSGAAEGVPVADRPVSDGSNGGPPADPDRDPERGPDRDDLGRAGADDSERGPADAAPSSDSDGPDGFGADAGGGEWPADVPETSGSSVRSDVDAAEAPPRERDLADPDLADRDLADRDLADRDLADGDLADRDLVDGDLVDGDLVDGDRADGDLAAVDYSDDTDDPPEEPFDPMAATVVATLDDEVVVIDERPRYHLVECGSLAGNELIPLSAREAIDLGFTPCGWCSPDRTLAGRHAASAR